MSTLSPSSGRSEKNIQSQESGIGSPERVTSLYNETPKKTSWSEILEESSKNREELDNYLSNKRREENQITLDSLPAIAYLNEKIFPSLNTALIAMLERVKEEDSFYHPKTAFNGIDFICEYLYNSNSKYPERQQNPQYIFDMDWVKEILEKSPRPYYPFSLVWNTNHAALKIQSFMKGYWVRKREDVQEMRVFWKHHKLTQHVEDSP
ncbi:uncharacterized protein LOC115889974 [Sitophilus oryzae]|uniref:Uncharacterized protein LOC115889974 n=1 Tax=Sitophilus oryzae TaxID=7048 RepID=A0A6J2YRP3_SITOR|nr:uncharacterized protein LOC115889974 [Sitophilus oryzae]